MCNNFICDMYALQGWKFLNLFASINWINWLKKSIAISHIQNLPHRNIILNLYFNDFSIYVLLNQIKKLFLCTLYNPDFI